VTDGEVCRKKQKEIQLLFIDLEKACGSGRNNTSKKQCRNERKDKCTGRIASRVSAYPYVFDLVMDVLAIGVKKDVSWSMHFADDIVLVVTSKLSVERKLERWRKTLEGRGLKIIRTKTEYLPFNCQDHIENIKLGEEVKCVRSFKHQKAETWPIKKSEERKFEVADALVDVWSDQKR
ncbi:uncharacterized protein LOC119569912, partial [Penaeus monodon]|uniref:uncharacterized protein LOC119569912 n=1 Tax=Penaeus monodon TaxID=6687 RepID=UPI0018A77CD7